MAANPQDDPVLTRYRAALAELFGERIARVVLFGSRARGDATAESDYDVAVFLSPLGDRWRELERLAALRVRFLDEADAFFDTKRFDAGAYAERTLLMHDIRNEGVDV